MTASALLSRLRLPVVAAPMFLASGPELVIAASRAGIIGSFPTPNCRTIAELDGWLTQITTALGTGPDAVPWALNLITHSTNTRLSADLEQVAKHHPPIVITALGSPRPVVDVVHAYGGIVLADVVSLTLARKAADAGADGLVCVSAGAGGHTGSLSPLPFIAAVRDSFEGLVCVGGGIATGAGVAGAVAAGADLVYMGTRFLASRESIALEGHKQMVVDSGIDDLVVSAAITGTPASWLRPSLAAVGIDPAATAVVARDYSTEMSNIRRWKDTWAAGQGLSTIRAIDTTAQIVDRLAEEYAAALDRAGRLAFAR
ncbi:NAD(P)H-dependent flavin oxidoreductase [Glaciibacter psychrotolerans]|uniref:Nitronate monooxygenase n=1 Tax=Glaciibacter psychrotolerans TaxID=670054 RepID=A0A7Z0EEX2_9MICO|nr:nitronate monooxygenase [Leifsonia psychrotolerans]NYJ19682.1 nitronate monooxygenase [Leifsonia psychrotolerans]